MSAPGRVPCGGVSGRTHGSAPTRWGRRSETNGNSCGNGPCQRGGTEPAPYRREREWTGGGARLGCGGVWSPRPAGAAQVVCSSGPPGSSAPTKRRASRINHPSQRRRAERLRQRMGGRGGNRGRDHPQGVQQRRTIPQSRLRRASSLYTREPCPAGDGGSGRRVVGPYGKPKPAGAQRSGRARGREGWAGIGAKTIPKRGPPPRLPGQRLAKRKARKEHLVKFDLCPVTSECSTGYRVRRSAEGPARAHAEAASTEQNSLAPHPVVQEDAKRPGCTTRTRFFF